MRKILISSGLALSSLGAQGLSQSTLSETLREPPSLKLLFEAHGVGSQIYSCQSADGAYTWKLKAPDAQLLGTGGQSIGHHFAGPTWQATDGSGVVGKAAANVPSPDAASIPWLRIDAVEHDGSGTMSPVVSIQRLNTKGGKPPDNGCDKAHADTEIRVPYQADYYFYGNTQ